MTEMPKALVEARRWQSHNSVWEHPLNKHSTVSMVSGTTSQNHTQVV